MLPSQFLNVVLEEGEGAVDINKTDLSERSALKDLISSPLKNQLNFPVAKLTKTSNNNNLFVGWEFPKRLPEAFLTECTVEVCKGPIIKKSLPEPRFEVRLLPIYSNKNKVKQNGRPQWRLLERYDEADVEDSVGVDALSEVEAVYSEHDTDSDEEITLEDLPSDQLDAENKPGDVTPMKIHMCRFCHKIFPNKGVLLTHTNMAHADKINCECPICGRVFYRNCNLAVHLKSHEIDNAENVTAETNPSAENKPSSAPPVCPERPFKCPYCTKCYAQRSVLKKHMVVHTVFQLAVREGNTSSVQWLVQNGVNINGKNHKGETALYVASDFNNELMVNTLLSLGADYTILNLFQETPIHRAAEYGFSEIIRCFKEKGANLNIKGRFGWTPLHLASDKGKIQVVKQLVKYGADCNATDEFGETPLHKASWSGFNNVIECLKKHCNVNCKNILGYSPVYLAAANSNKSTVDCLIACGSDPNISNENGDDIHMAIKEENTEVISLLVEKGASLNVRDKHGKSPLHKASQQGKLDLIKCLLDCGADATQTDDDGNTALHLAALEGHVSSVVHLALHGSPLNHRGCWGQTPLHWAAWYGRLEITRALIEIGADISIEDNDGRTPLHLAANSNHQDVVNALTLI